MNTYLSELDWYFMDSNDDPIHIVEQFYGLLFSFRYFYTLAEGIMISVRSLQRSEGSVSDPINKIYIFLICMTRRVDLAISVCPSVRPFLRKLVSQF